MVPIIAHFVGLVPGVIQWTSSYVTAAGIREMWSHKRGGLSAGGGICCYLLSTEIRGLHNELFMNIKACVLWSHQSCFHVDLSIHALYCVSKVAVLVLGDWHCVWNALYLLLWSEPFSQHYTKMGLQCNTLPSLKHFCHCSSFFLPGEHVMPWLSDVIVCILYMYILMHVPVCVCVCVWVQYARQCFDGDWAMSCRAKYEEVSRQEPYSLPSPGYEYHRFAVHSFVCLLASCPLTDWLPPSSALNSIYYYCLGGRASLLPQCSDKKKNMGSVSTALRLVTEDTKEF